MMPKISIVVPFVNEEGNVTPLLAEIRAVCDALGQSYEAIFVNDGSKDATGQRRRRFPCRVALCDGETTFMLTDLPESGRN